MDRRKFWINNNILISLKHLNFITNWGNLEADNIIIFGKDNLNIFNPETHATKQIEFMF